MQPEQENWPDASEDEIKEAREWFTTLHDPADKFDRVTQFDRIYQIRLHTLLHANGLPCDIVLATLARASGVLALTMYAEGAIDRATRIMEVGEA